MCLCEPAKIVQPYRCPTPPAPKPSPSPCSRLTIKHHTTFPPILPRPPQGLVFPCQVSREWPLLHLWPLDPRMSGGFLLLLLSVVPAPDPAHLPGPSGLSLFPVSDLQPNGPALSWRCVMPAPAPSISRFLHVWFASLSLVCDLTLCCLVQSHATQA